LPKLIDKRLKLLNVSPVPPVMGLGILHPTALMDFPNVILAFFQERSSRLEIVVTFILGQAQTEKG